ncbi:MAG TPA: family 78 glycoside hydrolase catalytic domain, partial [Myxococcales bacterium]|nr:family 78 glycoside hydrolase catalytic domain [Myxococcales bacterium]
MNFRLLLVILALAGWNPGPPAARGLRAVRLRTDALAEPLGIDDPRPEFSWQLGGGDAQSSYQVRVESDGRLVWDSGPVPSGDQFGIRYDGEALRSGRRYQWRVRLTDGAGGSAGWSEPSWFEMGILEPQRWVARWITGAPPSSSDDDSVLYLRGSLKLPAAAVRGRAYASALGWYRLYVNGADVTGRALVPRFTPFEKVVEYQAYDVTRLVRAGRNLVCIAVADGRFRGRLGFYDRRRVYGDRLAAFLQVELELADGTSMTWSTDETWVAGPGRIVGADPKEGERVDLRIPDSDWLFARRVPERFHAASLLPLHPRQLVGEEVPRVTEIARLRPRRIWRAPSGRQLVDFGQNAAGRVRILLGGSRGTVVRMRHSELLGDRGELDTTYLLGDEPRHPFQRDEIVLDGAETWYEPWFTIHGFRYLEVEGLPRDLGPRDVEAVVLSSALEQAGAFACSDARLNRLWQNVLWSTRSNFT